MREEIARLRDAMEREAYVTDRATATAAYLAMTLHKPLLIEGHPGVGKTEVAKVLARALNAELIRLQCYEGLDVTTALYEWKYAKQLLHIKLQEGTAASAREREPEVFSRDFLLERPLLRAMTRVILPLCTPGFLSAGIFAFTLAQNEFLYALLFLNTSTIRTVPVGVTGELIRGDAFYWGQLMAAAFLGSLPVVLIYSFFVKYYVAGLTAGSVKG